MISDTAARELFHIFSHLSIDWLYHRDISPEAFCKGKFKLRTPFHLDDFESFINQFCHKYEKNFPKECLKLKTLLEFTKEQLYMWESFDEDLKLDWMNKDEYTSFPMVLYKEVWTSHVNNVEELEKDEILVKPNTEIKKQAKEKVNNYFNELSFFEKGAKTLFLKSQISGNIIEAKYSHLNFNKSFELVSRLHEVLCNSIAKKNLELAGYRKYIEQYAKNVELLKKQSSLFLNILNKFKNQGRELVLTQISLDNEFFQNHSLMFFTQEVTENEKLQEILYEYISHNGIYYLDLLLQVNLYAENPASQSFFLHSPFKIKAKDSQIIYIKKEGTAESIKTIKQGRLGSLEENQKNPIPMGNKKNHQLSKYELIGRILKNIQIINLTYKTLQSIKTSESDLNEINLILKSLPSYSEPSLEALTQPELVKIAQKLFGSIATIRRIQNKYRNI